MPMLFSLGQHAALMAVAARLQKEEKLLAFLDDLCIVTSPDRTVEMHNIQREELWRHVAGSCQTCATFSSKLQELLIPQRKCGEAATRTELNLKELLSSALNRFGFVFAPSQVLRQSTIPQFESSDVLVTRSRKSGVEECDEVAPCRMGQLGKHHQDGPRTPPRSGRIHP